MTVVRDSRRLPRVGQKAPAAIDTFVTADARLRWCRLLIADERTFPCSSHSLPIEKIADLVVKMAREDPSADYQKLVGTLADLGHDFCVDTVKGILKNRGLESA